MTSPHKPDAAASPASPSPSPSAPSAPSPDDRLRPSRRDEFTGAEGGARPESAPNPAGHGGNAQRRTTPAYRPDIDGLRAVAVLSVIFYHAGFERFFGGGYVGVDVFFVISGYIITRMIASQLASGSWSLVDFYERRFRRILPPLFCMAALTVPIVWLAFYDAGHLQHTLRMLKRVVVGLSNFYLYATTGGYFDIPAKSLPFLHTWSLAVEEQFYLVFPVLLWLLWTRARENVLPILLVLAALALLSLLFSSVMVHVDPRFDFYMLPTRAYELLLGVLLALGEKRWPCRLPTLTHLIGLMLIVLSVLLFGAVPQDAFPGLWALLPCVGTALCIWSGSGAGSAERAETLPLTVRLLGSRPMRGVGLISYGLYLYHWPVLVFVRTASGVMPPPRDMVLILAAVFALSTLSWFAIEQPIRQKRALTSRRKLFAASLGVILAFIFLAQGARKLTPHMPEGAASYLDYEGPIRFLAGEDMETINEIVIARDMGVGNAPLSFVLLGDSHATMLGAELHTLAEERGQHGYAMVRSGYGPPPDQVEAFLERNPGIPVGLIVFRWTHKMGLPEFYDYSGKSRSQREPASRIARQSIEMMARHGVRTIFVMLPFPSQKAIRPANTAVWLLKWGKRPEDSLFTSLEENRSYNSDAVALLREIAAEYPQVRLLDPVPCLCFSDSEDGSGGQCPALRDGRTLYMDDDHITEWGALLVRPLLENVLRAAGEETDTPGAAREKP